MPDVTLTTLNKLKQSGEKITCLTSYDATFAKLVNEAGVEVILVGDSLGMVLQGHDSTLPVTVDDMAYHTRAVKRGNSSAFLMADLPFMSYATVEQALRSAALWDEVKDKLKRDALGLSGGQQQRLCIARGIALRPEVLLLDEPTSALDPIATGRIEQLVEELKHDYTIVIVTHNMQQAARVSDRTAFMYMGELIEFDATEKIFTKPAKKQTEDYITGRFG